MKGHATPFTKTAVLTSFDGSNSTEVLYIPRKSIIAIWADLCMTGSPTADGRCGARFVVQYFSGATVVGGLWSGGAWTTVVQADVAVSWRGAAGPIDTELVMEEFNFVPSVPFQIPVVSEAFQNDPSAGNLRNLSFQNTHTASPAVGEYDVRCFFTATYGTTTNVEGTVTVLAAEN